MTSRVEISELNAAAVREAAVELGEVLADCVEGGASVNFMSPYSVSEAAGFFRSVADDIAAGTNVLLAARLDGRIVGTVQLGLVQIPNQPHRGDVKKLLVHRSARNKGIAAALMQALESMARAHRRSLLVLDTATGGTAERLYARLGWQRTGVIPNYALWPDGRFCDTTVFWKELAL